MMDLDMGGNIDEHYEKIRSAKVIEQKEIYELKQIADKNIKLANEYAKERYAYAKAKYSMDVIFASKIDDLVAYRKNIGYETGLIHLMSGGDKEITGYYEQMLKSRSKYKALEKIIDTNQNKISLFQSIYKYIGEGEKYG